MSHTRFILPARDSACGRVFHPDRRSAEAQRVAMEVWYRAVGRKVAGHHLVAYRCKRCAGYHVAFRRVRLAAPRFCPQFAEPQRNEPMAPAWPAAAALRQASI